MCQKKVAIIISTKNRSNKLIEVLKYYDAIKSPHTIYIGDSSDSYHINKTVPVVKSLSKNININYKQYPEYSRGQTDSAKAIAKLLEIVEEEYAVGSGDDDYFIPKSLDKCVKFLENNPEYSSAHGYGTFISHNETEGKSIIGGRYILKDYNADSASERFKIISNSTSVLLFSVHPTKIFRKAYKNIEKLPVYPPLFEEIMPGFMSVTHGNAKKLDFLFLIRGLHSKRIGSSHSNLIEKIIYSEWSDSVDIFINTLSEELSTLDGIDEIESKEIVKQGFIDYLEGSIKNYYCNNKDVVSLENINKRVLNKFKLIIPVSIKNFIKKNIFSNDYYDRMGQLSKASPYYYEFKSLLDIVK